MSTTDLIKKLRNVAGRICTRCAFGHLPSLEDGEWLHGTDEIQRNKGDLNKSIFYCPSEPCDAGPVWDVIAEIEADKI